MRSRLLTSLAQDLDALQIFCHSILRHSEFRLSLPDLISRCVVLPDPSANGGSTGRAWSGVQGFGQKPDIVFQNAEIIDEHFHFCIELRDVEVQIVTLV